MNWIFGDNINTDLITPGRYNITTDPLELARIAFIEHSPEFNKGVKNGDFIIAGSNFGCGSSRETAVTALKYCGIKAIVAKSFARIFYRNCINQGLLAITTDTTGIASTDELSLDIERQLLINQTTGYKTKITVPHAMKILNSAGGIIKFIQINGIESLDKLFLPEVRK